MVDQKKKKKKKANNYFYNFYPKLADRLLSFGFKFSERKKKRVQGDIKSHIIDEFHHVDAALRG